MILETKAPLKLILNGERHELPPGVCFVIDDPRGIKLLAKAPDRVRRIETPPCACRVCQTRATVVRDGGPTPPILPGWHVIWRDRAGRLRGGCDERQAGTVQACEWDRGVWTVRLTSGDMLPLASVLAVSKTDATGQILAAWTVRERGYDGTMEAP